MLSLRRHASETIVLAAPLAITQLAQLAMQVTDTVLLGSLGEHAIAVGGFGSKLFFTILILLQGTLAAAGVLVTQARGAQDWGRIPVVYWTGFLLALLLSVPAILLLSVVEPILTFLGQPADLAHDIGRYEAIMRWAAPAGLISIGLMRGFLSALQRPRVVWMVTITATIVNGFLNYGLIHGRWGLPEIGFLGSAVATTIALWGTAIALLAIVHINSSFRKFVPPARLSRPVLVEIVRIGWPIGVTHVVEVALFLSTGFLCTLIDLATAAAHQIAISVAGMSFMVAFGIAQAANVRVGYWAGARRPDEVRRAGWVAMWITIAFMSTSGLVLITFPHPIIGLFVDLKDPANAGVISVATTLLALAALFQVADGVQTVASGCLRGIKDTGIPMVLATFGYWGIGFPAAYALAFYAGWLAPGVWSGLALGLIVVAVMLGWRFHLRSRGAVRPLGDLALGKTG